VLVDGLLPGEEFLDGEGVAAAGLVEAPRKLPAQQRECVILHKLEGLSFEQIAQMLDISETAARIRAHRGYERLRELLGEEAS
jgi:RNA polymerase sigma-70 factor (ECF subfamily)